MGYLELFLSHLYGKTFSNPFCFLNLADEVVELGPLGIPPTHPSIIIDRPETHADALMASRFPQFDGPSISIDAGMQGDNQLTTLIVDRMLGSASDWFA